MTGLGQPGAKLQLASSISEVSPKCLVKGPQRILLDATSAQSTQTHMAAARSEGVRWLKILSQMSTLTANLTSVSVLLWCITSFFILLVAPSCCCLYACRNSFPLLLGSVRLTAADSLAKASWCFLDLQDE